MCYDVVLCACAVDFIMPAEGFSKRVLIFIEMSLPLFGLPGLHTFEIKMLEVFNIYELIYFEEFR